VRISTCFSPVHVCPSRDERKKKRVERNVMREYEGKSGSRFYHRNGVSSESERRRGHARKREEEEIRGRGERGVRRVPGKPMILKEGREDAH